MANQFDLIIITPLKTVYQGKAVSLIAPCETGYLGVLANHAPFVGNLTKGEITLIVDESQEPLNLNSRAKGFIEVYNNNVTLLLNEASS